MNHIKYQYLIEEVREGFMVPASVKQAWAAELEVLLEIDRICRKHNIQYYADWGTFLGAVRHRGFIPWDDDLDICMRREDYSRFLKIAPHEFADGFHIQTYENMDPDNWLFMGKVVGRNHICFEKEHLNRFHGFPYIACVDIFVLDYVYRDEEKEKRRRDLCLYLIALSEACVSGGLNARALADNLASIWNKWGVKLELLDDSIEMGRSLYREVERQFALCSADDADDLSQLFPWGLKGDRYRFPKEYYDRVIYLPFENVKIPVPYAYDAMLRKRYGDYLKIIKSAGAHEYPYFEAQKERFFVSIDMRLPEYHFDATDCLLASRDIEPLGASLKEILHEAITELRKQNETICDCVHRLSEETINSGNDIDIPKILKKIGDCQQLAIDMGNLIESIKGEGSPVVAQIEAYCEVLYGIYQNIAQGMSIDDSNSGLAMVAKLVEEIASLSEEYIINKYVILFMPVHTKDMEALMDIYSAYYNKDNTEVYVCPMPYFFKEFDGSYIMDGDEWTAYKELLPNVNYLYLDENVSFEEFMALLHPDVIIHTNPYDNWHETVSVYPDFYSNKLKCYTDELIYVCPYNTDSFTCLEERDYRNMDYYVTKPGVIASDKIVVKDDVLKETYIQKLCEFCGEEYREAFSYKVVTKQSVIKSISDSLIEIETDKTKHGKKRLLYVTSLGCLFTDESQSYKKLYSVIGIFKASLDDIEVVWGVIPDSNECCGFKKINELLCQYSEEIASIGGTICDNLDEIVVDDFDAYYGDGSYLVHQFVRAGKPVMIQNYEL